MNKTEDMGNNETRSYGIFNQGDQGWLAMSRTQSKWFKTERGAASWLKRNYPELAEKLARDKAIEGNWSQLIEYRRNELILENGGEVENLTLENCRKAIENLHLCIKNLKNT
jgi:hypothetical protein